MRTLLDRIIAAALIATTTTAAAQTSDWPSSLFGPQHSSYNQAATAITPTNAATLVENWTFTDPGPTATGQPVAGFNASPTVVNGIRRMDKRRIR